MINTHHSASHIYPTWQAKTMKSHAKQRTQRPTNEKPRKKKKKKQKRKKKKKKQKRINTKAIRNPHTQEISNPHL
jgi:hypothetical protein